MVILSHDAVVIKSGFLLEQSSIQKVSEASWHIILMCGFFVTDADRRLMKETENHVNESSLIGNMAILTYTYIDYMKQVWFRLY